MSIGCRTAAAFTEYSKFEQDPVHYSPRANAGTSWRDAVLEFLKYQQFTQGRAPKSVEEQARYLERFGQRKPFWSLDSFTRDDIEAFLAGLQRGEVTERLVVGWYGALQFFDIRTAWWAALQEAQRSPPTLQARVA